MSRQQDARAFKRLTEHDLDRIDHLLNEVAADRPGPDASPSERERSALHALNIEGAIAETYVRRMVAQIRIGFDLLAALQQIAWLADAEQPVSVRAAAIARDAIAKATGERL